MRKLFVLSASVFVLAVALKNRIDKPDVPGFALGKKNEPSAPLRSAADEVRHLATEVIEADKIVADGADLGGVDMPPTFFPSAKVISRVTDPVDSEGRQRVIETVETDMEERYVRLERTMRPDTLGNPELQDEIAMVANQVLLQRPGSLEEPKFREVLSRAGAIDVKDLGDAAFLATFTAAPADPRALDVFIARVREVAGTELTIEPNYIRKMF